MGIYLEATYARYGSNWREGLFYTVSRHVSYLMVALPGTTILYPITTQDYPRLSYIGAIIASSYSPSHPPFHTLPITYSSTSFLPPS